MKGFTVIELIACMIIIGILSAIAIPKFIDLQPSTERRLLEMVCVEMSAREQNAWVDCRLSGECHRPSFDDLQGVIFHSNVPSIEFIGGDIYSVYEWITAEGRYSWHTSPQTNPPKQHPHGGPPGHDPNGPGNSENAPGHNNGKGNNG